MIIKRLEDILLDKNKKMTVLDAYKAKCENCNKAKLVCTKHFYIYCADSKLEEYYIRDVVKTNKFFTKKKSRKYRFFCNFFCKFNTNYYYYLFK